MDRTVVIIGGTFNPFTNAHKEMAMAIRKKYPNVAIAYVPTNLKYIADWKNLPRDDVFSGKKREDLIIASIVGIPNCYVTDAESKGRLSGKTYDTVQYFKREYDKVCICIGSDKLYEIEKWYKAEELIENIDKIILFTRGENLDECQSEFVKKIYNKIEEIKFDFPNISSSLVRKLYSEGKFDKVKEIVPEPVYNYLKGDC